jgi:hypothetical protein
MKYLVRLDVVVGIYVDVDVHKKELASLAAKQAVASSGVKQLIVAMVGDQGQFEYDHCVGGPKCSRIYELGDDNKLATDDYFGWIPSKFLKEAE